ncbi:MAG: MMPL family transporter [Nitrosomonas sp.]|nr:MMPL family transporter [Nitrosomonas sp.]
MAMLPDHPELPHQSNRFLSAWIALAYRHAVWIMLALLLFAALAAGYTARNLGVNTNTADMLSEKLPFRINLARFEKAFPQYEGILVLVLDAPIPEQAYLAATQLSARLSEDLETNGSVLHMNGEPFFQANGLLYKTQDELRLLGDRLSNAQPLIARITRDTSLHAFVTLLQEAVTERHGGRKLEINALLHATASTININLNGRRQALSWQTLLQDETSSGNKHHREFIVLQPKLDFDQVFAAKQVITTIHQAAQSLDLENRYGVRLRITGDVALAHEELNSAMLGAQDAGLIALISVAVILLIALRTIGPVIAVLVSLLLGLILTAAFATLAVGHLNLISIAFAVLYIGLGVDYAIHLLLRYAELGRTGLPQLDMLLTAGHDTGRSLVICAITTAIGFYAFIPTTYQGIAELGIISGTGMLISLIATLTVIPALQRYIPIKPQPFRLEGTVSRLPVYWLHHPKTVLLVVALASGISIMALPGATFDHNLLNMNNPDGEAVQTFRELLTDPEQSPWFGAIPVNSQLEAKNLTRTLAQLPEVDKAVSLADFIPVEQAEKLAMIDDISLTLGPDFFTPIQPDHKNYTIEQQRNALTTLLQSLRPPTKDADRTTAVAAQALADSLRALLSVLDHTSTADGKQLLGNIDQDLLALLPETLARLRTALTASEVDIDSLPESLRSRWLSPAGEYLVVAYPASNIDDNDALRKFVRAVQRHAPQVSSAPVIILEAGEAVVDAFIQAFILAFIGILFALLVLLRSVLSTLLVLIPLLLAALFTIATTAILQIPFNFANIIALPLLLGIGIDSSIHMVTRSRHQHSSSDDLLHTSTARAIFYSALTTMTGFGSLILSSHPGTASMGLLLTIGIVFILLCVFLVLPNLLQLFTPNPPNASSV